MSKLEPVISEAQAIALRLQGFQARLNDMVASEDIQAAIITAHCDGFLTHEETTLLFQIYGLTVE